jgi:hypothetical protein
MKMYEIVYDACFSTPWPSIYGLEQLAGVSVHYTKVVTGSSVRWVCQVLFIGAG